MNPDLIDLLKDGLLHLRTGGTVKSYLDRPEVSEVPADRLNELRSLLETASAVTSLRELPVPAPRSEASNRARFLSSAATLRERHSRRAPAGVRLWPRLARSTILLMLVLALLLGAGTGVVSVAADSLPGSALYPVKLAVEDARLMLTFGEVRRAELYLRYANERAEEMLELSAAGRPVDQTVVERFSLQMEGAVSAAASVARSNQPGAAMGILEQVIATASEQQQTLAEASIVAPDTIQPALSAGASAAQQSGQLAQQELAELIAVLPTPTQLAQLPVAPTPTPRPAEPTATAVPPPNPVATKVSVATSTLTAPATTAPVPTRTVPRSESPTPVAGPSGTSLTPKPGKTDMNATATPIPASTAPVATATLGDLTATPIRPPAKFRVELRDSADPVPASFRIHYSACVINEGREPLGNTSLRIAWGPSQCAYLPPDYPSELTFAIGSVGAESRACVSFSLNTSVICGGTQIVAEAVATCDQGSARESESTTLALPPTPTPTVTRTPIALFNLTLSDQPDPVAAGNALHLEICVVNHGDQALSNIVLEDIWTPRDCVYLPPDNPFRVRWTWKSLAAHSERCVSLTLNSYSTCEGSLVSNRATMTCDQGTASGEELTTVGRPPTATPTYTATPTLTESPAASPTLPATTAETPVTSPHPRRH